MQLLVEYQLNNIFLNHLSLVEQSTHKNVECSRFSVLHDKSSARLPCSIIRQPRVLFNAKKVVLYQ